VPKNWKKANITFIFKNEDPRNYRPVSLVLIPEKMMDQLILKITSRHMKDKNISRSSQHRFQEEVMLELD